MSKEQPIFGIDVHSEFQHGLNFERARAEGYEFCVIKASEGPYRDGDTYVPTGFKEFFRRAEAEGFVMGVYAFLLSTPARAQADHFLRTIDTVGGPEDKILMVDFEDYLNYPALSPGNQQLDDFIAEVKRRVGDHPIVVYSGRGFWNGGDSSGDFDQYGADAAWDAYYLHMDPVRPKQFYANSERYFQDAGIPWGWGKPWGGVEPWFWQFTSTGGVAGMNIDVNAYRGTSEQLLALTGVKERGAVGGGGAGDLGAGDRETRGGGARDGGARDGKRRVLTHGVIDGTNFAEGYKYVMQLNNRMKYWVWSSGPVPDGEGAYAVNRPLPPVDELKGKRIFCLTGDTQVIAKDIERSFKRRYSGEVITIKTARGRKLTGTPNHLVLTDKGWLPLHALKKGSYVIGSRGFGKGAGLEPDNTHRPTTLEQVHRSLALSGEVERVVGTPLDFHGDGMDGEVELVGSEGVLLGDGEAALLKQGFELGLSYAAVTGASEPLSSTLLDNSGMRGAHHSQSFGFGESAVLEPLGVGVSAHNSSLPESVLDNLPGDAVCSSDLSGGRAREVFGDDGFRINVDVVGGMASRGGIIPMQLRGFFDTSHFDAGSTEPTTDSGNAHANPRGDFGRRLSSKIRSNKLVGSNVVPSHGFGLVAGHAHGLAEATQLDTSLNEASLDGFSGDSQLPRNARDGAPSDILLDKVVGVDVCVFEGHVYNLQTTGGAYVANGIISHNCAGVPNLFRRASGKSIPTRGDDHYDGGIAAYFYTSAFGGLGPGFFSGVDVPFQLATAKKWARETGSGVLVGRSYRSNSLAGQGHVAILLPDGKVLQSFQFGADGEPGLNTDYTIEESHAGGYYEVMVHPKDWINDEKERDEKERDEKERDERERDEKERDEKRRRDGRDEEPHRPEPVQEFTDEEFEEIGREILKLFSRLRQNRTRRREP